MTTKRTFKRELAVINRGRVALGYKPLVKMPKGIPDNPKFCPINKAMKAFSTSDTVDLAKRSWQPTEKEYNKAKILAKVWRTNVLLDAEVKLPKLLSEFVEDFDNKQYPELILE